MRLATRPKGRLHERDGKPIVDRKTRLAIYMRDGFRCCMCGISLRDELATRIRLIHWIPKNAKRGGTDDPTNLLTACRPVKVGDDPKVKRACNSIVRYRARMDDRFFRPMIEEHLSKPLNLDKAQDILDGGLPHEPNPWWHLHSEKQVNNRRIGERKKGSKVRGSQNIAKNTRLAIYIRDDFKCQFCGERLIGKPAKYIALSCLIPFPEGTRTPDNLVTTCKHCACSKKNEDWRPLLARKGILQKIQKSIEKGIDRRLADSILSGEKKTFYNPWKQKKGALK